MLGAPEFGADFQRVLIRTALEDIGLRRLIGRFIESNQLAFTDPASAWAWRFVQGGAATVLALKTEAAKLPPTDPAAHGVIAITGANDYLAREYVTTQIVEWARRQTFQAGFEEARQAWNTGNHAQAYDVMQRRMAEIASIRLETADRGWFFEEFEERQQRRVEVAAGMDTWATGIDGLDNAMNGGVHYGELHVPVAYSGIGKSFYCTQVGYVTARSRGKALHYVLEGGRTKTEDRYEARWAETSYRSVRIGDLSPDVVRRMEREYAILRHNLVIRGYGDNRQWHITADDIVAELDTLRTEHGWIPDVVIVDYGDLVHAPGADPREQQKNAFRQLKVLAERQAFRGHRGYAVVAPSQAVRPAKGDDAREHILKPRDIADCYEKVRVADSIMTINRTDYEKEMRRARVHLGKYRDDEDGGTWRVTTDYAHGAFSVLGEEPPPLPPRAPAGAVPPPPPTNVGPGTPRPVPPPPPLPWNSGGTSS